MIRLNKFDQLFFAYVEMYNYKKMREEEKLNENQLLMLTQLQTQNK